MHMPHRAATAVALGCAVTSPPERRIALFIDFENLVTNTGITAPSFNLQPALDRLLEKGKVIFRRAYCDWSRFREAKGHLHEFGVELVDVPPSTRAGQEQRRHAAGHRRARALLRARAHQHLRHRLGRQRLLPAGLQAARERQAS